MGRELRRLMVNQPTQCHPPPPPPSPAVVVSPAAHPSIPTVVLDHVGQLDDELALFVLLTALKGVFLQGVAQNRGDGF